MRNILTLILLFLFIQPMFGLDTTIILKDGEILKVDLLDENLLTIVYKKKDDGSSGILSREEVLKIIYKDLNQDEISQIKAEEKSKILEYRKLKKKKKYENRKQYELESEEIEFEPAYIDDKEEIHIEMASIPNEK
ncbi:MAG: hypothetical protein IPL26_15245 [Leptospiraceae bacterium]|nr:hypothetical protein [Leptospiraceae bacterium]